MMTFEELEKANDKMNEVFAEVVWLKLMVNAKWIPCKERLPETHQDVLLELRSGEILTGFKAKAEPYFYCHGVVGRYVEPQNVLAWQPLPEPYKAER